MSPDSHGFKLSSVDAFPKFRYGTPICLPIGHVVSRLAEFCDHHAVRDPGKHRVLDPYDSLTEREITNWNQPSHATLRIEFW
jgi:hypothetical protein